MTGFAGRGARQVLSVPGEGTVLWARPGAAWLRLPGGIVGLADTAVPAGPLWINGLHVTEWPAAGDRATLAGRGTIEFILRPKEDPRRPRPPDAPPPGERAVRVSGLAGAEAWDGGWPATLGDDAVAAAVVALGTVKPSALAGDKRLVRARHCLTEDDLPGAAERLGGYGPGLTPAGDDVLAGILLAARTRGTAEAELLRLAGSVTTTDLSAAFLHWAARGQHIAPVHDLLVAAAALDAPAATEAAARLARFGSTSGGDVAAGLRLGLTLGA